MAVSHRGAISFGLVHIPVGLYTATQALRVANRQGQGVFTFAPVLRLLLCNRHHHFSRKKCRKIGGCKHSI